MARKKKKDVVSKKHNAIKKSKKIAMTCPQCTEQFPKKSYMEEELVNGIVTGYSCPECAYHVDAE